MKEFNSIYVGLDVPKAAIAVAVAEAVAVNRSITAKSRTAVRR